MLSLREKDRVRLIEIAENTFDIPVEIWAFGSRVNGNCHHASDLDLVIRTPDLSPVPWPAIKLFKNNVSDSNIPIMIDILGWQHLPKGFIPDIEKSHHIIYTNFKA